MREYNDKYDQKYLDRVAFPLGGIGAGMICVEGTGAFSHLSLEHAPDVAREAMMFGALCIKAPELGWAVAKDIPRLRDGCAGNNREAPECNPPSRISPCSTKDFNAANSDFKEGRNVARILEGPVPDWKKFQLSGGLGNGASGKTYGLPRFGSASFKTRFPFAEIELKDDAMPLSCSMTTWSPFIPGDADNSSLPGFIVEYTFANNTSEAMEAVFSFHSANLLHDKSKSPSDDGLGVKAGQDGFICYRNGAEENPDATSALSISLEVPDKVIDHRWFRGGWFDSLTMLWNHIENGDTPSNPPIQQGKPSSGGSIYVPFKLSAGEKRTTRVIICWHVPNSDLRFGDKRNTCACDSVSDKPTYKPWYATRFTSVEEVSEYFSTHMKELSEKTELFSRTLYDTTLPSEAVEAAAANLTILKSPTVLRQHDGRIWAWEGCCDAKGCCAGTCTHVWNYAQSMCHLFPDLERGLRQTEFNENQAENGHQVFRAGLPIRPLENHDFYAASDGQLGGIMKLFREWRISGDDGIARDYWPKLKASLDYCISTWDPDGIGVLVEPHHNTYDIEFWGADGMCSSFYLGALKAATLMGRFLNENVDVYADLYRKGREYLETKLYNGEYFIQKIQWRGLRSPDPVKQSEGKVNTEYSDEARALLEKEGPKYQYGTGCLSDGVLGAWMALVCGVGEILDPEKVTSHLMAVHKYNLKRDLSTHANPQRSGYALGKEGGLLLCSWPNGDKPSLPFVYSDEVWTGIEYQVASHLIMMGKVEEGLEIVRICRDRYDGRIRNPFNEYECGHWYARAMASYALIQALGGARYDAVEKILHLRPAVKGDYRAFLCAASGYGVVGVKNGEPFVEIKSGKIEIEKIEYDSVMS